MKFSITLYFAILFYSIGALTIENDVNYNTWKFISSENFAEYHKHLESLLKFFMFTPLGLSLILNVILVFYKNLKPLRIYFLVSLILLAFIITYSLIIQVPLHIELESNYNENTLNELIKNHKTIRLPATILLFVVNIIPLYKLLNYKKHIK